MLKDVLLVQKRELERRLQERYVRREFSVKTLKDNDLIKVVIGPRRAGKSFFAVHLVEQFGSYGYVNFDDERLAGAVDCDDLLAALNVVYRNPRHLLLDEIQNLNQWELFVNRLQRQGYRLVVTGSNSNLLSTELSTHLTGRHVPILLFPFSFNEYLQVSAAEASLTTSEQKELLNRYGQEGGFPEPLVKDLDRRDYLRTLVHSVLYKDIVKRFKVRAIQGMEDLANYLFSNIAAEYSFQNLSRVTRCRSTHTVEKYIRYLEEAFLFFSIRRFSWKVREQAAFNKKIYAVDNGFATALGFRFSANSGRLYENLVAISLRKKELNGQASIFFWKNPQQEEVDFVIKEGLKITQLIQVCWNADDPKTEAREIRALVKASEELKCRNLMILTEDTEKEKDVEWFGTRRKVQFVPLWKWLVAQ